MNSTQIKSLEKKKNTWPSDISVCLQAEACVKRVNDVKMDFLFEVALILINGWQQVIQGLNRPLTCKGRPAEAVAGNMES